MRLRATLAGISLGTSSRKRFKTTQCIKQTRTMKNCARGQGFVFEPRSQSQMSKVLTCGINPPIQSAQNNPVLRMPRHEPTAILAPTDHCTPKNASPPYLAHLLCGCSKTRVFGLLRLERACPVIQPKRNACAYCLSPARPVPRRRRGPTFPRRSRAASCSAGPTCRRDHGRAGGGSTT
jgi:hypothetical protein